MPISLSACAPRVLTVLLPLALLTAGCSDTRDAVATVADCAGLVSDLAGLPLDQLLS